MVIETELLDLVHLSEAGECRIETRLHPYGTSAAPGGYYYDYDLEMLQYIDPVILIQENWLPANIDFVNFPEQSFNELILGEQGDGLWFLNTMHIRVRNLKTNRAYHVFPYSRFAGTNTYAVTGR